LLGSLEIALLFIWSKTECSFKEVTTAPSQMIISTLLNFYISSHTFYIQQSSFKRMRQEVNLYSNSAGGILS